MQDEEETQIVFNMMVNIYIFPILIYFEILQRQKSQQITRDNRP